MRYVAANVTSFLAIAGLVVCSLSYSQPALGQPSAAESQVRSVEEQFRIAKLKNDVKTLGNVVHDSFSETNQNGNSRNKAELLELFRTFPIQSLTTDSSTVRIIGEVAVVSGSQTEVNGTGTDRMLFMRVYLKSGNDWKLLTSTQFRNPKLSQ